MQELKFRYVYKHEITSEIKFLFLTLKEIEECKYPFEDITYKYGFEYVIISRDMFTGKKDKEGIDIYEGDRLDHPLNIVEYSNGGFNTNGDRPLRFSKHIIIGNKYEGYSSLRKERSNYARVKI